VNATCAVRCSCKLLLLNSRLSPQFLFLIVNVFLFLFLVLILSSRPFLFSHAALSSCWQGRNMALFYASFEGHTATVELLLKKGAHKEAKSFVSCTIFIIKNHLEVRYVCKMQKISLFSLFFASIIILNAVERLHSASGCVEKWSRRYCPGPFESRR